MKYAQARSAQHPELKDTYDSKIKAMKAAGAQQQGADAKPDSQCALSFVYAAGGTV
jgi:hypothetical protein